jgi:hypothetical protein
MMRGLARTVFGYGVDPLVQLGVELGHDLLCPVGLVANLCRSERVLRYGMMSTPIFDNTIGR